MGSVGIPWGAQHHGKRWRHGMSDQTALYQWTAIVSARFEHLSKPQAAVLALWSLGLVLTRSCALTAVGLFWATALGQSEHAMRQRPREWCDAAADKAGA